MNEKQIRSSLLSWYREALAGNPGPMVSIVKAIESLYLFDLVSDSIYDFSCYLLQNLCEIDVLDDGDGVSFWVDKVLDQEESEVIPFG